MTIVVRPMTESDGTEVARLVQQLFPSSEGRFSPEDRIWIARRNGRMVGFVRFSAQRNRLMLNGMGILPSVRDHGVGTQLLECALHEMQQETRPIYLKVNALNPAVHLYDRFGFVLKKFGKTYVLVRKPRT